MINFSLPSGWTFVLDCLKNFLRENLEPEVEKVSKAANVLLIKYAMTFLLAIVSFILTGLSSWGLVFAVSITVATLNYLLGDFYVLPKLGNITASVANGALAGLAAYFVNFFFPAFNASSAAILVFAVLIALGEYFFHRYIMKSREVRP
ncbi:MAG: DUF2512 family protein [Bacillota bacterium]